MFTLKV